jgi:hypothetical protein
MVRVYMEIYCMYLFLYQPNKKYSKKDMFDLRVLLLIGDAGGCSLALYKRTNSIALNFYKHLDMQRTGRRPWDEFRVIVVDENPFDGRATESTLAKSNFHGKCLEELSAAQTIAYKFHSMF